MKDVFKSEDLSIGSYRFAVATMIPRMTKVALATKSNTHVPEKPDANLQQYHYYLSRADYEKEWGRDYERPGLGSRILAFLFKLVPKVGPFRAIDFKVPNAQTEDLYLKSVDDTIATYKKVVGELRRGHRVPELPDLNFDTSQLTRAGQYRLADDSYRFLLGKLAEHHFKQASPEVRADLERFYADPQAFATVHDKGKARRMHEELEAMRGQNAVSAAAEPSGTR